MQNSYLAIRPDPLTRVFHPLVDGLHDIGRLVNGTHRVKVATTLPYPAPPLTLIESYPDLPMEMVWPRVPDSDIPQVYARQVGAGRVVYFPWDIDRAFWEVLCVDHGRLLANAVRWATNEEQPVTVTGRPPGEPDQSDDDEGADPRVVAGWRADGAPASTVLPRSGWSPPPSGRDRARRSLRSGRDHRSRPVGARSRSHCR
jgi:hypothetical protein